MLQSAKTLPNIALCSQPQHNHKTARLLLLQALFMMPVPPDCGFGAMPVLHAAVDVLLRLLGAWELPKTTA
jgi:hypothetical protein